MLFSAFPSSHDPPHIFITCDKHRETVDKIHQLHFSTLQGSDRENLKKEREKSGPVDQHNLDVASKSHLLQNCQREGQSYSQWVPSGTMAPNVINREQSIDSNSDTSSPTEQEKSTRKHHNPMPIIVIMAPDNAFDHLLPEGTQYSSYPYHCSQQRYWRSKKATFLFCIVIMVLLALFCITIIATTNIVQQVVQSGRPPGPQPLIRTSCGPVKGEYQGGSWVFRGIPYAMPPVGHQRWKPPTSNQMPNGRCWEETHMATSYPSVCFQMDSNRSKVIGSEDCLYLSVWMPHNYNEKKPRLPVVVMMQGEGQSFHKDTPQKSFEFIRHYVNKAQAVFVSVNYRLDILGFLPTARNFFGRQSREIVTGNFGLMDQILALKWIQKNIEDFGGNYSQVTVYGESSGTETMLGLLTSPKAQGLFQRMLAINPSFLPIQPFPRAVYANNSLFSHTGCHGDVECLMMLEGGELMMATSAHRRSKHKRFKEMLPPNHRFPLIIDGETLVSAVTERGQIKEKGPEVPVMIGFSNWYTPCAEDHLEKNFTKAVQSKFKLNVQSAEEIIMMYTQQKNESNGETLEEMLFDIKMCRAQKMLSNINFPVYYSIIRPRSPSLQESQESPKNASSLQPSSANTGALVKCSKQGNRDTHSLFLSELQQLWKEGFSLIKTGRPSTSKVPNTTALISDNVITIEANYHQKECAFWSWHKTV